MRTLLALALLAPFAPANEEYFPLPPGAEWKYQRTEGGGDRVIELRQVESAGPDGPWMGATVAIMMGQADPLPLVERVRYGRQAGFTYRLGLANEARRLTWDPPVPILPPEMEVGHSWSWRGNEIWEEAGKEPRNVASEIAFAIEKVEEVRTPSGNHRAFRVRETHVISGVATIRWYAEGVGVVQERETDDQSEIYVAKLEGH